MAGCPGCHAFQVGLPAKSHSSECRTLVQQRLFRKRRKGKGLESSEEKGSSAARFGRSARTGGGRDARHRRRSCSASSRQPEGGADLLGLRLKLGRKSPQRRGAKREGDEILIGEQQEGREAARGSSDPAPSSSSGGMSTSSLEMMPLLETRMFPNSKDGVKERDLRDQPTLMQRRNPQVQCCRNLQP